MKPPLLFFLLNFVSANVKRLSSSLYGVRPGLSHPVPRGGASDMSLLSVIKKRWEEARDLALLEQEVEDHNAAEIIARASTAREAAFFRRLIAMPLSEEKFDPPPGAFSHGHVQTGDKMSLPVNFWRVIQGGEVEVPWLFEVSRVEGITGERFVLSPDASCAPDAPQLNAVVGGPIDFRAPANYVFLPRWMFVALGLRPRDVVYVKFLTDVPPGSAVRLRPHSSEFTAITDHRSVLETELRHYSALTAGSTVAFDYDGRRYYFDVMELRSAPKGAKVPMVKVTDCDVAAEFVRPRDQMKKKV